MREVPPCPLPEKNGPLYHASAAKGDSLPRHLTHEEALGESRRCLSLHICQGCEVCQLVCPDQAIAINPLTQRPIIDLFYCKGCGLCAHLCPKGAIAMVLEQEDR